jgi:hypothetical protein
VGKVSKEKKKRDRVGGGEKIKLQKKNLGSEMRKGKPKKIQPDMAHG